MKKNTIGFFAICTLILSVFILGCPADGGKTGGPEAALRAVPKASDLAPNVLDSYSDGTSNYYLIDVGYIEKMYVSTLAIAHYNGMTPISLVRRDITTNTVTEALTETVSNSITISDTQNVKVGIEVAWKKKFLVGQFSAKVYSEWKGSWTYSDTTINSTEASIEKIKSVAESITTSFTVGEHGEPAGWHRYALYALCDVYFLISTSLDNQQLKSWDTVVCARDSSYIPHMDFSSDGIFDNSPISGNEITFSDGFYKDLTPPGGMLRTEWETIRTDTQRIVDVSQFNQHYDLVNFDAFGINLDTMRQQGYKTISFYFRLNVREIDDGAQRLFLYSSPAKSDDYLISSLQFEHSPGKDSNWWVHYESQLKFEDISIDKLVNPEFIIRYGATGNWEDTWENKDLKIQLLFKK